MTRNKEYVKTRIVELLSGETETINIKDNEKWIPHPVITASKYEVNGRFVPKKELKTITIIMNTGQQSVIDCRGNDND